MEPRFLRQCLEEAQVDSFFAQNDLRGAGLAAQDGDGTKS